MKMDQLGNNTNMDIEKESTTFDYSKRSQWLRAAVLGANDGLVSTASLMMGVGAVKHDVKAMILSGFAGMVAGACSMAIGEFVSVYSQYDIQVAQMERDSGEIEKEKLPSPLQAAAASALAFSAGAIVPLLAAAFVKKYHMRIIAVVAAVTVALVVFGWLGAALGKAPAVHRLGFYLEGGDTTHQAYYRKKKKVLDVEARVSANYSNSGETSGGNGGFTEIN